MNLLFVVDSLSLAAGANVNIIRTLTKVLKKRNCNVFVLTKSDCKRPISEELENEFDNVYCLPSDKIEIIPNLYKRIRTENKAVRELTWLINHPGVLLKGLDSLIGDAYLSRKEFTHIIEKICATRDIDAVIGVSSPYFIARAVSKANINAVKALYQLDPFTNNHTLKKDRKSKRRQVERQTIDNLDIIFMPDFIKDDVIKNEVYPDCEKLIEANLPGIIIDQVCQLSQPKECSSKKDEVKFIFAGKMYRDIRNPKPLFQMFTLLPNNYVLHILGSGCEREIAKYKKILGDRLMYHGYVEKKVADSYIRNADVLVNIDNTIKNQMPSKIVDYICQQKRIINICSDLDCLAAQLLIGYSNGINICINDNDMRESAKSVVEFMNNKIEITNTDRILEKYRKYSDYFVADTFLSAINKYRNTKTLAIDKAL